MKSSKIIFILFLLVAVVQLAAPVKMIYDQENILKKGKAYKFLTQPLDPNDPFRGKFVRLNYEINSFKTTDSIWERKQDVYVYLKDSLGFAKVKTISKVKLPIQDDYVIAKTNWFYNSNKSLSFSLPFNRFYMEEYKAKPAEDLVRRNRRNRDSLNNKTYALVFINEGNFVLKDVLINDVSLKDLVHK